ncbi:hypothetical protein Patl1_29496 [Pistacia atlantica]|uniref:Uncharacterized protein n=1 Tax=Pistacia atlantica TaxID=434234 RepID=A0ACC1AAD5_9ROSI|nr:hypothetical protein Patl1_29496 [Pistacia atlantica]
MEEMKDKCRTICTQKDSNGSLLKLLRIPSMKSFDDSLR